MGAEGKGWRRSDGGVLSDPSLHHELKAIPVRDARYPAGTFRGLIDGPHVSAATCVALLARITEATRTEPRFFGPAMLETLRCVCVRFVPEAEPISAHIAGTIDARLADGTGNGWRFDDMPPDGDCYRIGLTRIDELSVVAYGSAFALLDGNLQDDILREARSVGAPSVQPSGFPGRFFEELLVEVAECAYSHPLMQEWIGYVGMADVPRWTVMTLGELEDREPRALRATDA